MKYLILIHGNLIDWDGFSEADKREFGRAHRALSETLSESGELVVSQGLADPELARSVSVRDGQTLTSDGPFAEVKEHLAGFYLVECPDLARATEIAALVPDAALAAVEVRPVLDLNGLEM